jgi:molybdopterin synthase sulfur carrier subunit/adenylyltransferase/sulfurtransferase
MAQILIPTPLRKFTENTASVQLEGETVIEVMQNLTETYPSLKAYLLDGEKVKPFIKVFKGDDDIAGLKQEKTEVTKDDVLSIIPAIAGGKS